MNLGLFFRKLLKLLFVIAFRMINIKKLTKYIPLLLGIIILFFFLNSFKQEQLSELFANITLYHILVVLLLLFVNIAIKSWRWQLLVKHLLGTNISLGYSFKSIIVGVASGSIIPGRAGEFGKPMLLKLNQKIPLSKSFSAMFIERIFDFITIMVLFIASLFVLYANVKSYSVLLIPAIILLILCMAMLFVFPKILSNIISRIISFLTKLFKISKQFSEKLQSINFRFFDTFLNLKRANALLFLILSVLAGLAEVFISYYALTIVFSISIPFNLVIFSYFASALIGIISMIPGGIGVSEASQAFIIYNVINKTQNIAGIKMAVLFTRLFSYYLLVAIGTLIIIFMFNFMKKENHKN